MLLTLFSTLALAMGPKPLPDIDTIRTPVSIALHAKAGVEYPKLDVLKWSLDNQPEIQDAFHRPRH